MNAARLLEHFERISDAADAVPRLRRFVLDLAVRGALVAPEAHDKPVSLADAKARSPQVKAVDLPIESLSFTVPAAWRWAYLTEFANVAYGFAFASNRFNSSRKGMPLIRIRDIANLDTEAYFDGDYDEQYIVRRGDYVVGMDGSFNVRRWRGSDSLLNQRVLRIKDWHPDALCAWCQIPLQMILDHVHGQTSQTTVKHLSAKQMNGVRIPLPPLAEQHRIVAKVDELMAVCDRLEAAQSEREARRDRLVSASLARVINPDSDDANSATTSAPFHVDHFARLTTRPEHVKQLRQTILNLAVHGRLIAGADNTSRTSLGDVASLQNGYAFKSQWFSKSGIRLLRNTNVSHGLLRWNDCVCLPEKQADEYERFRLVEDDIVVSLDRPFISTGTKVALVKANDLPCLLLQRVGRFSIDKKRLLPTFLFLWLTSPEFENQMNPGRSLGVPHISSKDVEAAQIHLPPLAEQRRIVAKVDELMALCDQLEASLASAATDRARLLEALLHEALAPAA